MKKLDLFGDEFIEVIANHMSGMFGDRYRKKVVVDRNRLFGIYTVYNLKFTFSYHSHCQHSAVPGINSYKISIFVRD
jgi:hypothetical protein